MIGLHLDVHSRRIRSELRALSALGLFPRWPPRREWGGNAKLVDSFPWDDFGARPLFHGVMFNCTVHQAKCEASLTLLIVKDEPRPFLVVKLVFNAQPRAGPACGVFDKKHLRTDNPCGDARVGASVSPPVGW